MSKVLYTLNSERIFTTDMLGIIPVTYHSEQTKIIPRSHDPTESRSKCNEGKYFHGHLYLTELTKKAREGASIGSWWMVPKR